MNPRNAINGLKRSGPAPINVTRRAAGPACAFNMFFAALTMMMLMIAIGCDGADEPQPRTAAEVKLVIAEAFANGMEHHGLWIQTEEPFDPLTHELRSLRVTGGDTLLHAERAEIIVDLDREEMSLRLHNIVAVSAGMDEPSSVERIESQMLGPVSIAGYIDR